MIVLIIHLHLFFPAGDPQYCHRRIYFILIPRVKNKIILSSAPISLLTLTATVGAVIYSRMSQL